VTGFIYRKIIKPILFKFPADDVHSYFLKVGRKLGKNKFSKWFLGNIFAYKSSILGQEKLGIVFKNPVGLAAGFDYDADLINILPSIGFGFNTIGTVTHLPYEGNPRPMLGRLPKSKSLLVNKGFKSRGIDLVLKKVSKSRKKFSQLSDVKHPTSYTWENKNPLGISIGSTNKVYKSLDEMAEDIILAFKKVVEVDYFDYYEINISCPNLINASCFTNTFDNPEGLDMLLTKLSVFNFSHPVFIKMHLEEGVEESLALVEIASHYKWISGLIFSNLAKDRSNPAFDKSEISKAGKGNFSGKPTEKHSNELLSEVYKKYGNRFLLVGCGGVFTGSDAYEKIKRGATLVQMITGMIYQGPGQIGIINKELAYLLKKDGYKNISEAIGAYYK